MPKVKIVSHLTDKGWPVQSKKYKSSHLSANKAEKKADPKTFNKISKMEKRLSKHELMAKHTKSGTIEIERKFAKNKKVKKNLIKHEVTEHKKEVR